MVVLPLGPDTILAKMEKAEHIERRLAAILSADVHGYSRMMAEDDVATVREVKRCREIFDAHVREHYGRIVDAPGDNSLAEFPSAVEAVQCAVEVQRELADRNGAVEPARRMEFRIGIHVGDVILEDGKIYGDGVNIAARLEALATPGGICISSAVHEQIRGKLDIDCEDIGEQQVKNIPRPVRVLRVRMGPAPIAPVIRLPSRGRMIIASIASLGVLATIAGGYFYIARNAISPPQPQTQPAASSTKATVAVLPFADMSPNKDDEYFSDGMTDEIIGHLSKIEGLQVAARTSSFAFKGQNQDAKKIGGLLGVRTLLEGSVRRSADKLRIEVELIDASSGFSIWSQSYDRPSADVFEIQSQVAENVADKLKVTLLPNVRARVERKPTDNLEAYNLYLLGRHYWFQATEDGSIKSIDCFKQAIEKDPNFALAYAFLSASYAGLSDRKMPPREAMPRSKALAQKALALDDKLAIGHGDLAVVLWAYDWNWAESERESKRGIEVDPSFPGTHLGYGLLLTKIGRYAEASREMELAHRLDPLNVEESVRNIGMVYLYSRNYDRAVEYLTQGIEMYPDFFGGYQLRGLALSLKGDAAGGVRDAEKAVALTDSQDTESLLASLYAISGRRSEVLNILDKVKEMSRQRYVSPMTFEAIYGALGDKDQQFYWLEKAYENRSPGLTDLNAPWWDGVRSDPRFQAIYEKVGLPD